MTSIRPWLCALALAGCSGEADTPTDANLPTGLDDEPSPYIYDEDGAPEAQASLVDIQDALQDAFDIVVSVNAVPVNEAYEAAMAGSGGNCPYYYNTPDGSYWYDSCTAPTGAEFDGYIFAYEATGIYDPYSGFSTDYWYAFGGATVNDPQGHQLEMGGLAVVQESYGEYGGIDIRIHASQLQGTFAWDGAEADGTWLRDGIDPDLLIYVTNYVGVGAQTFLDGGFGGLDGWAIAFDNNAVTNEILGSSCEAEVNGTIGVRSPEGDWYDIRFDGPDEAEPVVDASVCDGCGTAYYQGEEIGEICADVTPLLVWGGVTPW